MLAAPRTLKHFQPFVRRSLATVAETTKDTKKYKVVVVGGGTGGLAVSSTISKLLGNNSVALIEPSNVHFYQPLWTLVGGGLKTLEDSRKPMSEVIPQNVNWIRDRVIQAEPEHNSVTLSDGNKISYDFLVVAAGIQINWDKIKGLKESIGKDGVASNYSAETVTKTWEYIKNFNGGNAIFTMPNTPVKCPGAPVKIVFLAEDWIRKNGVREKSKVIYNTSLGKIFGIDHYGKELLRIAKSRDIQVNYFHELTEIDASNKVATFKQIGGDNNGSTVTYNYDLLHVTPPMGPPSWIAASSLANSAGWVDVNQFTLRHNRFKNVFALGDCTSVPTSKTAAAIAAQSLVLKKGLIAALEGKAPVTEAEGYDGYTSCPLIVGTDKLILAEFSGFDGKPLETFPIDQSKERESMMWLNKEIIPEIYWQGLLRGVWTGPATFRKAFAPFKTA
ncbi:uncharacterized protein VTP21DRAFT_10034 [Calcarisporiella thermophila]|uniref:uncharacterized protein n=1 Tax=Calcarisporiella thermophila TaxID=911321 RepID=UPI003742EDD5